MKERKTFYLNKNLSEKLRRASFYENRPQSRIVEIALSRYMKGIEYPVNYPTPSI